MPVLSKNQVAFKVSPNWASKPPSTMSATDGSRPLLDDSLTNLNWLHNLNIMGEISASTPPTPPASPGPLNGHCPYGLNGASSEYHMNENDVKSVPSMPLAYPLAGGRKSNRPGVNSPPDNIDYKSNGDVKPPYSYATLICMAMKANKNKMSLSAIYKWIRENFMYYRRADAGWQIVFLFVLVALIVVWQNSIRHNLSLNKCFIKVPRSKDEPGKGGFWRLDPTYAEEMADGTFKKRRLSNRPSTKKMAAAKKEQHGAPLVDSGGSYFLPPPVPPSAHHAQPPSMPTPLLMRNDASGLPTLIDEETEAAVAASSLKGDFCWNSVLNEDIEMDGMRYKTVDMVDMDGGGATVSAADYGATYRQMLLSGSSATSSITCLSSPALSLDDEDLLVSDASNDLDLSAAGGALVGEWWRLTAADSMTVATDPQGPFAMGPLGGSQYDVCGNGAAAAFLGHGWDDVTRPVLDGSLDLEGLIDLDVY